MSINFLKSWRGKGVHSENMLNDNLRLETVVLFIKMTKYLQHNMLMRNDTNQKDSVKPHNKKINTKSHFHIPSQKNLWHDLKNI